MFLARICSVLFCVMAFYKSQIGSQFPAVQASEIPKSTQIILGSCRNELNGSTTRPEIRLPFMDMLVQHNNDLFVLHEPDEDLLLLLHVPHIFKLHVATGEQRLVSLGNLEVRGRSALGVEIVSWRHLFLLAVVLEDHLVVFQLSKELLLSNETLTPLTFEPLQEFLLPEGFLQIRFLKPSPEKIILLVTSNHTSSSNKCRTFEWLDTYFNPIEEIKLPTIRILQVVGRQPLYIIFGRFLKGSHSKLVLTVYELNENNLSLQHRQALTIQAHSIQATSFRGRNCFIACTFSAPASCLFFRMFDGQFVLYRKPARRDLNFHRLSASQEGQLLIGARSNGEVLIFSSTRLDCYSGFRVHGEPEPSGLFFHRNKRNESFLLLVYRRSSADLIRTVQLGSLEDASSQVSATPDEDFSLVQLHRHEFEESINALRGLLLRRRSSQGALNDIMQSLKRRVDIRLEKALHVLERGHVKRLRLANNHLRTPNQVKQRLEDLQQRFGSQLSPRRPRSFGTGNENYAREKLNVRQLRVGNLIYQGPLMSGHHWNSSGSPLLTIRDRRVLTKILNKKQLWAPPGFQNNSALEIGQEEPNGIECVVRHFQVKQINSVSWESVLDSLFLRSRDNWIKGQLLLQSRARVFSLLTPLFNGLVVDRLFNTQRAQVISSNIYMSAFFAPRLEAQRVNGLNFAQDILFRGDNDNWVKTPVRIYQMNVSGHIRVANQSEWRPQRRQLREPEEQRLQQYYTGKITIRGSLTVRNIQRDTENSLAIVGNQPLARTDLSTKFLLNETVQVLPHLMFEQAKVNAPSLTTIYVYGHPFMDHLLTKAHQKSHTYRNRTLHIIFMNASVQGDIISRNYSSRLRDTSEDIVRHGQEANLTGQKHFQAPLFIKSLQTNRINGTPINKLMLATGTSQNFNGTKSFARLVVADELRAHNHINVSRLTGLPLQQLLSSGLSLQRLELTGKPDLKALYFGRLNGLLFDDLLSKASEGNKQPLLLHKQLLINGNVRFQRPLQLQSVNGLQWQEYQSRLIGPGTNAELRGKKTFMENVQLNKDLNTPHINNVDISFVLENTLLRKTPQKVSGPYTFRKLVAVNVNVSRLNGASKKLFIDTRKEIELKGNLYMKQLNINGKLKCPLGNKTYLSELKQRMERVQQHPWLNLLVTGDALWNSEEQPQSHLAYLRQHAVRKTGNQSIAGHVLLERSHLKNLQAKQSLPVELNFTHLAEDALLRFSPASEGQVILALQELLGSVKAKSLHLERDALFGLINGINIGRLNSSLYSVSTAEPVAAKLHFYQAPKIRRLQIGNSKVNGAPVEYIHQQVKGQSWAGAQFQQILVEQNLSLANVNEMSLDYFLQHRIPLRGAALEVFGSLSFEQLQLGGQPLLRSINGIQLENLVVRYSHHAQSISGAKTFHGGVRLTGPGHVMYINSRDLSESYRATIFRNRNYNIDSLVLDRALFTESLVLEESQSRFPSQLRTMKSQGNALEELQELLSVGNNSHRRLLYLEYDTKSLELTWLKPSLKKTWGPKLSLTTGKTASCQRWGLQAQLLASEGHVLLANVSMPNKHMGLDSVGVEIKVQNHCHRPARRVRSRVGVSCRNESHTLGMHQPVAAMELVEMEESVLLLLGTEEEVRVLRLMRSNCSLSDWQSVLPADGRLMKVVRVAESEEDLLLTSGMSNHRPVLAIHLADTSSRKFKVLQLIQGPYDLAEIQENQLLLSCLGCRLIAIFKRNLNPKEPHFGATQQLSLQERIQQLTPFKVGEEQFLLVLTQPEEEHFFLFSYNQVAGWQQHTFGYKRQHQWAWPLVKPGQKLQAEESLILLLCGKEEKCDLVKSVLG
ncbi:uncharacterized protein LOC108101642 [Drosophila ficusphila]|uniref:uncharacterized protein LOC108101642 n=1 Tax=Drosophila ficusphila TaxID=30025 RepID=UPI0007E8B590|nr:uncharacterized protein LOC108101642 [Drosophila ficusphila]